MNRPIALVSLLALLGCGAQTQDQVDGQGARLKALEQEVAALNERVAEVEAGGSAGAGDLAQIEATANGAAQLAGENALALDQLQTRVDGHDLAVAESGALLLGLETQLFDPDYGEVARIDGELDALAGAQLTLDADLAAARAASTANTAALASLGGTVSAMGADVAANSLQVAVNAVDLAQHRADIDSNDGELLDHDNRLGIHEAAIVGLTSDLAGVDGRLVAAEGEIAANTATIAANSSDIAAQGADVAANQSAIADNGAAIGLLQTDVAANGAAIGQIQSNYLPPLDDLLLYLSADTATDRVNIAAADLFVDGRLFANHLTFRLCDAGDYNCTPRECLDLCQANGERLATTDEVLAWASGGNDYCRWSWMVDRNNPSVPVRAYPMYNEIVFPGCGPLLTGDVPRFGGGPVTGTSWEDTAEWNCACSSL